MSVYLNLCIYIILYEIDSCIHTVISFASLEQFKQTSLVVALLTAVSYTHLHDTHRSFDAKRNDSCDNRGVNFTHQVQ